MLLVCLLAILWGHASVAGADGSCPNESIRKAQGATYLPGCMAFEQATPSQKNGADAGLELSYQPSEPTLSANGNRLLFVSRVALDDDAPLEGEYGDVFIASRGAGNEGWRSVSTAAAAETRSPGGPFAFSTDLGRVVEWQLSPVERRLGYFGLYEKQVTDDGSSTAWLSRSSLLRAVNVPWADSNYPGARESSVSSDFSHVLFTMQALAPALFPDDPTPAGPSAVSNTYLLAEDAVGVQSLSLLTRDDQTATVWGEACGAWPGGGAIGGKPGGRGQGAISPTGERIYLSTRPASVGHPNSPVCDSSNQIRILSRTEQPSGAAAIAPIVPVEPQSGNDFFEGASADGTRVYFTTTRALDPADTDVVAPGANCSKDAAVEGCDLYLYDSSLPVDERLVQVSAGAASSPSPGVGAQVSRGVTAISGDGSRVYFVAEGVLTTDPSPSGATAVQGQSNLYVYGRDQQFPQGHYAFLGGLDPADRGTLFGDEFSYKSAEAVPLVGETQAAGGDGHVLVFMTAASLTPDDGDGTRIDAYRYDAEAATGSDPGALRCISCRLEGVDNEPFDVADPSGSRPSPRMSYPVTGRWSSEDGNLVLFSTGEPLSPGDGDDAVNLYLWHTDGSEQRHIKLPASETFLGRPKGIVSQDGTEVAFETTQALVAQDGDVAKDVYVARAGGGYPAPRVDATCQGSACQPPPTHAAGPALIGSSRFQGSGNVPARKQCRKHQIRRRGKCVAKKASSGHRSGQRKRGGSR